MKKAINTSVLLLAFFFVACAEPKNTEEIGMDVPFSVYIAGQYTPGEEVTDIFVNQSLFITPHDEAKVVIVNNDEELKKYLEEYDPYGRPYPYPSIDFSNKTLLLVGGRAFAGVVRAEITGFRRFISGKYELDAKLELSSAYLWGPSWCIPVLTNKIGGDAIIEANVTDNIPEELKRT
jgi:hypothetical protein